jgi:NADPH2:quinone reductase
MLTPMLQDLPEARAHQGEILKRCAALIGDGKLKPHVSAVLPLADVAKAHQAIEAGHVQGKIVLDTQL